MPMHDWTRVLPGIFHDFHQRWIVSISNSLNDGRLPENYYAMPLYLTPDYFISVPLEETYRTAYRGVPKRWKDVVEGSE